MINKIQQNNKKIMAQFIYMVINSIIDIKLMQQQLILSTIQILPATMDDILHKIQTLLSSSTIEQQNLLANIIKSLFYGLWNFDKMINQHNLNTKISQLLTKIPKKNALLFLRHLLSYLHQKWNFIDHHRINKFMQLVRYLLVQSFKLCEKTKLSRKKIDKILVETIFDQSKLHNGLVFHIIDVYFQVCQQNLANGVTLEDLYIFQQLLTSHSNQHLRLYIIEHVYEKYKDYLIQTFTDLDQLDEKIHQFGSYFLQIAKKEEKQLHRKNFYSLVGYAKSEELSFAKYMAEKRQKALVEQEKKKKKITKSKKLQIKKLKQKRKDKKKLGKKIHKIKNGGKFEDSARLKKGIQQL